MIWVAVNEMSDEYRVEVETEDQARALAQSYFEEFARREWAGCYGKRRLAAKIRSLSAVER